MKVNTHEATVENGQIELPEDVILPDHARVYVVVPGVETASALRVLSPRLAQPGRAADFKLEVTDERGPG